MAVLFMVLCTLLGIGMQDSLTTQLFKDIEDMLLKLYYLYEKSPKKCRELSDTVGDLKEVFELPEGGNLCTCEKPGKPMDFSQKKCFTMCH